jgi:hypothetical protein
MPLQLLSPPSVAPFRRHHRPSLACSHAYPIARVSTLNAISKSPISRLLTPGSTMVTPPEPLWNQQPSRTPTPGGRGVPLIEERNFSQRPASAPSCRLQATGYELPATRYPLPAASYRLHAAACRLPAAFLLYSNHAQLFGCEPFSPSSARPSSRNSPKPSQRDGRVSSLDQARLQRPRLMPERIPAENVSVGQILNRRFVCATLAFLHRKIKGSAVALPKAEPPWNTATSGHFAGSPRMNRSRNERRSKIGPAEGIPNQPEQGTN